MRAILCSAFACLLASAQNSPSRAQSYPSDIARSNSLAFAAWRGIVPPEYSQQPWIASLAGTGSPIDRLTLNQKIFYYGKACIPHDCPGNFAAFLIATDGSEAFGLLVSRTLGVGRRYFGAPNGEARVLLERKLRQQ